MLITRNVVHPDPLNIINRRSQPHRICDVARTGFESPRRGLIGGLLKRPIPNHIPAAAPPLRILQNIQLALDDSDTGRPEHLVPGANIKVAIIELNVGPHVRNSLRAVQEHFGSASSRLKSHCPQATAAILGNSPGLCYAPRIRFRKRKLSCAH